MKNRSNSPIAVIGLACWYPDSRNPRQMWENVLSRRRQFRQLPDQRLPVADYYHSDPHEPDKTYGKQAAVIDGFDFDWASMRIPQSTFNSTDITHWLSLEVAINAIKDAGYSRDTIPGEHTGVILGNSLAGEQSRANTMRLRWPFVRRAFLSASKVNELPAKQLMEMEIAFETYFKSAFPAASEDSLAGGLSNTNAGRICNYLDLKGGGYVVDGACSSSLLAVATAASKLAEGDLDLVLAGGVDISLDSFELIGFAKTRALTDNEMTVYDRRGDGFIPGEGCGFVVLKRMADAVRDSDYIYGVLQGWGISSDGGGTGLTAPSAQGQARALKAAYDRAPYGIHDLNFIEGHGTGTTVGDRVELEAISIAMGDPGKFPASSLKSGSRFCGVTSLKSLIGHTKAASGIGGFIKAVSAVNRRVLPPTAACRDPQPIFDTVARSLYPILSGEVRDAGEILRAGVSSMGFGGINCHVTVESGDQPSPKLEPSIKEQVLLVSNQQTELFVLAADSDKALLSKIEDLQEMAKGISIAELADLAFRLGQDTRPEANIRCAVIAGQPDQLLERLKKLTVLIESNPLTVKIAHDPGKTLFFGRHVDKKRIGMVFPGQGSQQLNMARILVERFQWAKELVDQADKWITEMGGHPVSPLIYHPLDQTGGADEIEGYARALSQTETVQPAICLCSILWFKYLQQLGITPELVGGHSLGELTAFCAAGGYGEEELIKFAAVRGRAMAACAETPGAMVSLICSRDDAEQVLAQVDGYLVLANINGPRQSVLSGGIDAVEKAIALCGEKGIKTYRLKVSNAFHSKFAGKAYDILKSDTTLPESMVDSDVTLFTSTTGAAVKPGLGLANHFAEQVLAQVDFVAMIESMANGCDLLIEVGPGRVLTGLIGGIVGPDGPPCQPVESLAQGDQDLNTLLAVVFTHGVDITWSSLYESRLIRPFVPARERRFIENPCEKRFNGATSTVQPAAAYAMGDLDALLAGFTKLPKEKITQYLNARGGFLADVIRSDMKYPLANGMIEKISKRGDWDEKRQALEAPAPRVPAENTTDIESVLFRLVHEVTGFPSESLTSDLRLLDDLNLDSIKAGDLVAKAARAVGLEGDVETLDLAKSTLAGIVTALGNSDQAPLSSPDILEKLIDNAVRITGYPKETLDPDLLIEKDLNISLERLKTMIQETALALGVDFPLDLEPLLHRNLKHIAAILERIVKSEAPKNGTRITEDPNPWVRDFVVDLIKEPWEPLADNLILRGEDNWSISKVLVLGPLENDLVLESLEKVLFQRGAQVKTGVFKDAKENQWVQDSSYSHIIAVFPRESGTADDNEKYLAGIVDGLASVAAPPPAAHAPRRRTTVTYVQFGGGYFGDHDRFANLDQCGALALGASLHLERNDLRVRVLDFSSVMDEDAIAERTIREINTPAAFAAVGFDSRLKRRVVSHRLMQPVSYHPRPLGWSADDLILVTGGAKGITASCALALAVETGVRMALVGSSLHPDGGPDLPGTSEIAETLGKFKDKGIDAGYFSCDVSDPDSVDALVLSIGEKMGPITGVIHGAGLNQPREISRVSSEMALKEIAPKVLGVLNLFSALKNQPMKMFAGLSSIIGVTGMPGNGWYGFSNEALNLLLRRYGEERNIATLCVAYSIWRDEGMGARLGSVGHLKKMGIDAIPTEEGANRFVRLFLNDPGTNQVIVTARLGGMDTWNPHPISSPVKARYLEGLIASTPGVESVFKAHLTLDRDPYLKDHLFNGSYLFPTVFGLEAMAQVVAHATGDSFAGRVRIENILLERPITVDPDGGADIVIRAEVKEGEPGSDLKVIQAGISKVQPGTRGDYFSALFILGLPDEPGEYGIHIPETPLGIDPGLDLYNEQLLFQGPSFQRIDKIQSISVGDDTAREAVFTSRLENPEDTVGTAFPDPAHQRLILGDPFFRDSLLQAALLLVPEKTCLPFNIKGLDIYPRASKEKNPESVSATAVSAIAVSAIAVLERREDDELAFRVVAVDAKGRVMERLDGYILKILKHNPDYPVAADLANPDQRDTQTVQQKINEVCSLFKLAPPELCLKYIPGIHEMTKAERHIHELPLIRASLSRVHGNSAGPADGFDITWLESGKPVVTGMDEKQMAVSLSHDERLCLCVAGPGPQGCDIAPVTHRNRRDWTALLGKSRDPLLDKLLGEADTLDLAGTRIWAAMEVVLKSGGESSSSLEIVQTQGRAVLFRTGSGNGLRNILTLSMDLTWGPGRVFALVVQGLAQPGDEAQIPERTGYEDLLGMEHIGMSLDGPQGQGVFVQSFPVGFRPNAQLSRTVYFTNYCFWLGEVREASVWPVLRKVGEAFAEGTCGQVTNDTHIHILGEATVKDRIEVKLWASDNRGPANSTMELTYDFRKILSDGTYERVARCTQNTTWVEVLGHGIVKPEPYPDYYWKFMESPHVLLLPQNNAPNRLDVLPEPLAEIITWGEQETELYGAPGGPNIRPLIHEQMIETSLDNSNLVGNIYFANYFAWQGQARDRYFYDLIPEYFRGTGERGELLCLESRVDHLREAMPFDRIVVTVALKQLKAHGAVFYFEYFKLGDDGMRTKLAFGEQTMIWVTRDSQGKPAPAPFPSKIKADFYRSIEKMKSGTERLSHCKTS
ncbi:MAG: SDR family NAD(P)-dependent oxidoreductase [Desulfobacterium sp.]|nr:SDR family NAD(P)-dependent oxidoreductase [Desulfobacterium sp.]